MFWLPLWLMQLLDQLFNWLVLRGVQPQQAVMVATAFVVAIWILFRLAFAR